MITSHYFYDLTHFRGLGRNTKIVLFRFLEFKWSLSNLLLRLTDLYWLYNVHHNSQLLIFNVIDPFGDKMLCPILKSVLKWNLVYCCTSQFTIADFKCDWCIWWQNVHSRQCHLNIMRMQNPHFYLTWAACSRYASMTHLQLDN